MKATIAIYNKSIQCEFEPYIVRIYNDDDLKTLLAQKTEVITTELITAIKAEYLKMIGTEFTVSDNSMEVEIWGHVYAEKMAEAIKSLSSIKLIDDVADKIIYHAERIDIGEHGHDSNRFVWDGLAHFKSLIVSFLPKEK